MNENKKNILNNVLFFIVSVPLGYLFYRFFSLGIINKIYYIDTVVKGLFLFLCHVFIMFLFLKILFKVSITNLEKKGIVITYWILMALAFFDRVHIGETIINLNPLDALETLKNNGISILLLNCMIFIPFFTSLKWTFKNISNKKAIVLFFIIAFSIELIQLIFKIGIFDINDVILYTTGFFIGIPVYNFIFKNEEEV